MDHRSSRALAERSARPAGHENRVARVAASRAVDIRIGTIANGRKSVNHLLVTANITGSKNDSLGSIKLNVVAVRIGSDKISSPCQDEQPQPSTQETILGKQYGKGKQRRSASERQAFCKAGSHCGQWWDYQSPPSFKPDLRPHPTAHQTPGTVSFIPATSFLFPRTA